MMSSRPRRSASPGQRLHLAELPSAYSLIQPVKVVGSPNDSRATSQPRNGNEVVDRSGYAELQPRERDRCSESPKRVNGGGLGLEEDRQPYPSKPTSRHFKTIIS